METEEEHTTLSVVTIIRTSVILPTRSRLWLYLLIIQFIEKERRWRDSSQYLLVSRPDYYSTTWIDNHQPVGKATALFGQPGDSDNKLTTLLFIWTITTVISAIATYQFTKTLSISTSELVVCTLPCMLI